MSMLDIKFAGPLCSVQDSGRTGFMRYGVTESGPMDRLSFSILAAALDSTDDFNAIEVSLGGLVVVTKQTLTLGFCGGEFDLSVDGEKLPSWGVFTLSAGKTLTIRPGSAGSWGYLGCPGGFEVDAWLGSQAAHIPSGLCGGMLVSGTALALPERALREDLNCAMPIPEIAKFDGVARVVPGPQDHLFPVDALSALFDTRFTVSREYDRMGMRLTGATLAPENALSIPSEAIIRGSLQVPGHGDPIVLLADHQTTGGYPKIGTVITCDQDTLAQARAGDQVMFREVTAEEGISSTRARASALAAWISEFPSMRGSLTEKLHRVNLISGIVGPDGEPGH